MIQSPDILAAPAFVTPAFFIAGLLLVSIPIVIHILNRRRFKTVTWAAMEYLLRAMRKNRRRLKFEQMILLVTRCLVLALLGAALARPMMCENAASTLGGRNGLNVLVIDNSYSMAYAAGRTDAPTHLAQAKKIAKGIIDRLNAGGESVAVITTARPIRAADAGAAPTGEDAIVVRPGFDLEAAKNAIDRIEQSYLDTDLPNALQLAHRLGTEDTRQSERRLYLLTDATRGAYEGSQSQALQQLGQDLSKLFRVTHYNLTDGRQQSNLAALDVKPDTNLVTTKFGANFAARIGGFGNVVEAPLHWYINDNPLPDTAPKRYDATNDGTPATANVTTDSNSAIQSGAKFATGGPQVLTVTVAGSDGLKEDDTRRRVIDVAAELKVLIVEGQRGISALEGSGAFLQVALAPARDAAPGVTGTNSYVSAELISDLELGNKPLDEYSTIVLAGVGNIVPSQADALSKFVKQGGTLMTFMGEAVNSENYNAVLQPRKLIPGPLVKRMSTAQNEEGFLFAFPPQGVPHPFLKLFVGEENTGLETARVFTYWEADVASNSGVERILDYLPRGAKVPTATQPTRGPAAGSDAPDPAITVHTLGRGRVVFVSTTANSEWTTLPAKVNYVTLVHELLQGSVRTGDYWMNLTVGQSIEVPPAIRLAGAPTLLDSSKRPILIEAVTNPDGQQVYKSRPLAKPGVYTLAAGNRVFPIVVNIPPGEADVRTIGNEGVKKALGGIELMLRGDQLPTESVSQETGNDLSWLVMVIVFGLLLIECAMAMLFGHYRRTDIKKAGGAVAMPQAA